MGMFPHTITVLNKVLRGDDVVYLPSVLSGTLFVRLSASTKSTTGLDPSNVVKVTIPMSVKAQKPFISSLQYAELSEDEKRGFFTLKEDDIIVKGIIALNEISLESINSNYEEKMVIKSVDTFDFGNLKHWQVGGA